MKRYSIGQFAKKINKTQQTLRNWNKNGKLKPEIVDEKSGYRYYTEKQLQEFYGENGCRILQSIKEQTKRST